MVEKGRSLSQVWNSGSDGRRKSTIGIAADEIGVVSGLTSKLLKYLGLGWKWLFMFARLILFAVPLSAAWYTMLIYYLWDKQLVKNIPYGSKPRNYLDIYLPRNFDKKDKKKKYPVFVFFTGGAWIIGYKAWGSLFGKVLSQCDVIVVTPDYRNFPQGFVSDMVEDATAAIKWVFQNISQHGGDVNDIYLCGQSAGAHISATLLINKAMEEVTMDKKALARTWKVNDLKAYIGISGPYDLRAAARLLYEKGLGKRLINALFETPENLITLSPSLIVETEGFTNNKEAIAALPPFHLFHGTSDVSASYLSSVDFATGLTKAGVRATTTFYEGKTHTDPIIEDPMKGGKDALISDLLRIIKHKGEIVEKQAGEELLGPVIPPMVSSLAIKVSNFFNPF